MNVSREHTRTLTSSSRLPNELVPQHSVHAHLRFRLPLLRELERNLKHLLGRCDGINNSILKSLRSLVSVCLQQNFTADMRSQLGSDKALPPRQQNSAERVYIMAYSHSIMMQTSIHGRHLPIPSALIHDSIVVGKSEQASSTHHVSRDQGNRWE